MGSGSSVSAKSFDKPMTGVLISTSIKKNNDKLMNNNSTLFHNGGDFIGSCTKVATKNLFSKLDVFNNSATCATFMDSRYNRCWLRKGDADALLNELTEIGNSIRPKNIAEAAAKRSKYPLWTKYYGLKRSSDGARALDRWGSYHESWVRVEEPCDRLKQVTEMLKKTFNLTNVNSMVVNYYFDGKNTYIPAHRDTTACLEDGSSVYCLSLGSSRDFVVCDNNDIGKFEKADMKISRQWRVGHGDLFAIGPRTNDAYLHAITREPCSKGMRISIIFRCIDKSFIDLDAPPKEAVYSDGKKRMFRAECISTVNYSDSGFREHLSDLITEREIEKARAVAAREAVDAESKKMADIQSTELCDSEERKDSELLSAYSLERNAENRGMHSALPTQQILSSYYQGYGAAVPDARAARV